MRLDGWESIGKISLEKGQVEPENAVPISLPLADPITEADVQHVAWTLVRRGRSKLGDCVVPIADLVATQAVVDSERVARDEAEYLDHCQGDESGPLVFDGRSLIVIAGLILPIIRARAFHSTLANLHSSIYAKR